MRVAAQRLTGIEAVDVSLERAVVDIRLREGNPISLEDVRRLIRSNGFTPREATVTAVGAMVVRGALASIEVSGSKTILHISETRSSPPAREQAIQVQSNGGGRVELTGTVERRRDGQDEIGLSAVAAKP